MSGCHIFGHRGPGRIAGEPAAGGDWHRVATEADRKRLRDLRAAWNKALKQARASGNAAEINALGALADPDVAQQGYPPAGRYRCRTIKLGGQSPGMPDYMPYPQFDCAITALPGGRLQLEKLTGSQRQQGILWPDGEKRMVFLGTIALGDEKGTFAYGADNQRDQAGVLERVEANRWRLALPWPHWESTLDLIELVPAG